jgi:hypothetical protein
MAFYAASLGLVCAVLTSDGLNIAGKGVFPACSPLSKNKAKIL